MMLDTILKGDQQMTIPSNFELIWLSGFKGDDLNVSILIKRCLICIIGIICWSMDLSLRKFCLKQTTIDNS
jgi:hypothetical protein